MDIKLKFSLFGLLIVIFLAAGYGYFSMRDQELHSEINVIADDESNSGDIVESKNVFVAETFETTSNQLQGGSGESKSVLDEMTAIEKAVEAHIQANPEEFSWMNEGDLHVIYKWIYSAQGFHFQDAELYDSYDLETLEALADQGDSLALYVLPRRYMEIEIASDEDRPDLQAKIDAAYLKAAAYGSTYALRRKASEISIGAAYGGKDEAERRKQHIAAMSYLTVAERRGYGDAMLDKVSYVEQHSIEPFTEEELAEINQNADKLYGELEQERERLGLPPFDNSVPKIVERYYDSLLDLRKVREVTGEAESGSG